MSSIKKTAGSVSQAVREYLDETGESLESSSFNLVNEKIFIDKKEYTVECASRQPLIQGPRQPITPNEDDALSAKDIIAKLLTLMHFISYNIEIVRSGDSFILRVSTQGKNGLLIGKNGQNIIALQYLLSAALDKSLRRHAQIIIDVDSYLDKRAAYLRTVVKTMVDKAVASNCESITELLPSYERKLIHEAVKDCGNVKTFSIGRGSYKKVVITPLL
jgi:predicted RNA-binding protein Jag